MPKVSTERLFTQADVAILPDRGRFTALECVQEWCEQMLWLLDPATSGDMRASYHESERDYWMLLPYLSGHEGEHDLTSFYDLRDLLRERLT